MRFRLLTEAGYHGYSMSNNAVSAYESGEKPLSNWDKDSLLQGIKESADDPEIAKILSKLPLKELKDRFLTRSSWHHTSSHYNRTNFYSINDWVVSELTPEKAQAIVDEVKNAPKAQPSAPAVYKGDIDYLEWTGTRKHPRPIKHRLEDVNIEERGSFYIVTDDSGNEILRKKMGSNGTHITKKE